MTRYDITDWSDFVRGLVSPAEEEKMQRVLDRSETARRHVAALRQVTELARAEAECSPPDWAVRSVKALGSLHRPQEELEPSLLERVAMSLTFDSLTSPALAGTRDVQAHDRQLVYETDAYRVDLRLEPQTDLQKSVVVGQLLRSADDFEPMADVAVLAKSGDEIVSRVHTGRHGEFQSDGLPIADLDLFFLLDDERCLELQVANAHDMKNSGGHS